MLLPIKILKGPDEKPFIPFVSADAVFINGTQGSWQSELNNRYTKPEVDAKFEALGTVMNLKGTLPSVSDLPATANKGDVYLVGTVDPEAYIYLDDGWESMGALLDLSDYSTTSQVQTLINNAIASERDITTTNINNAMNNAVAVAKDYTDDEILTRQPMLESGVNIKTINDIPVIGSGNISTPNTTYKEISPTEIKAGTSSTTRAISGRRIQAIVNKARTGLVEGNANVNNIVSNIFIGTQAEYDALPNKTGILAIIEE